MVWTPIELPTGPPPSKEESDTTGYCATCGAVEGQPCKTPECGTWE
jgi:hypothetical protein